MVVDGINEFKILLSKLLYLFESIHIDTYSQGNDILEITQKLEEMINNPTYTREFWYEVDALLYALLSLSNTTSFSIVPMTFLLKEMLEISYQQILISKSEKVQDLL
jgi:hypothetical protein